MKCRLRTLPDFVDHSDEMAVVFVKKAEKIL